MSITGPVPAEIQQRGMELLRAGVRSLGLTLTAEHIRAFQIYYEELESWNRRFNLTTVTGYEEVQVKHFLDSLTCLLALPTSGSFSEGSLPDTVPLASRDPAFQCIDVGSGAGFPGLPMKILCPSLVMTCLDATQKKVTFLEHVIRRLRLENAFAIWGRAEDVGQDRHHRERYDVALARAVAPLAVLVEYCLPLCRKGGRFIAQKSADIDQELVQAESAISLLGGKLREVKTLQLPGLREARSLVVIDKVSETPSEFPRRAGIPKKRPLS